MARTTKRRVKRNSGGRQELIRSIGNRSWYELPDWAIAWLTKHAGRAMLIMVLLLSPVALLAIVLGSSALPLHYVGIASSNNALGVKALIFMLIFGLLVVSIKPLMQGMRKGWWLAISAAMVNMVDNVVSGGGFGGFLLLGLVVYLYAQVKHRLD